jgi:hypothetical protein
MVILKQILLQLGCEGVYWIQIAQGVIQYGLCENGYELLAPNKQVFIDLLNNY